MGSIMTDSFRKYRLTSKDEPTDEMLLALMKDVEREAIRSHKQAEAEKKKRLSTVADEIKRWRS